MFIRAFINTTYKFTFHDVPADVFRATYCLALVDTVQPWLISFSTINTDYVRHNEVLTNFIEIDVAVNIHTLFISEFFKFFFQNRFFFNSKHFFFSFFFLRASIKMPNSALSSRCVYQFHIEEENIISIKRAIIIFHRSRIKSNEFN